MCCAAFIRSDTRGQHSLTFPTCPVLFGVKLTSDGAFKHVKCYFLNSGYSLKSKFLSDLCL